MASRFWIYLQYVFIACLSCVSAESNYTLYISKTIRPGFEITFTFNLLSGTNPVDLTSTLTSKDDAFSKTVTTSLAVGSTSSIKLGTVPVGYEGSHMFILNISGVDSVTNDLLFEDSTKDFEFTSKSLSILIQTDKAIYQPGQTIKYRAICLRPNLRPYSGNVTYKVLDPNDNIVLLENDVPLNHGVVGGEFPLSRDAVDGDWKIVYVVEEYKEELIVKVEFYKLPKFEVTIDAPSVIHHGSPGLTLTVSGKYTFGKPVDGSATLHLSSTSYQSRNNFPIYGYKPAEVSKSNKDFDGLWEVFLSFDDLKQTFSFHNTQDSTLYVTASVTEKLTGTTFNSTLSVEVKPSKIKVDVVYKLSTIKPGLTYTAYIHVSEQDGSSLSERDRTMNNLLVDVRYNYPWGHVFPGQANTTPSYGRPHRNELLVYNIPADGLIEMKLSVVNDEFQNIQFQPYTNTTNRLKHTNTWTANRADSPSDSYLQIITNDNNISPGAEAQATVLTTEYISTFNVMLISRGEIVGNFTYQTTNGEAALSHALSFTVTAQMTPNLQILASYVRSDGEIVADFTVITVTVELENQVSITTSSNNVDAGDAVNITVQTSSSGAYVGLRAIDKSVLLLRSGNDISRERVIEDLNDYSVSESNDKDFFPLWCWYPRPSGAKDASAVFKEAGLIVLTNALLYADNSNDYPYYGIAMDLRLDDAILEDNVFYSSSVEIASTSNTVAVKPRTKFPETWLWKATTSSSDGSAQFSTRAPDTITSWVISAFSVSDQYGLGVANTSKVTVFRNFFISLNFPLKITRGEIVIVQANIFNYFKEPMEVALTLAESEKFELVLTGDDAEAAGRVRYLQVPADGATSVYFPLRMNTLGEVPVTVSALSELAQDGVTRRVFVRPEGIEQCYSISTLINRETNSDPLTSENLVIKIPEGSVTDSGKVKLFVYGEILGSTMHNLGRLLHTPGGCGEQNMIGFAPDVFVTLYLNNAGILDQETREKAYRHFQEGYSNELNYKHENGSYSAFGKSDSSGSTWLTAFVAKCFMFARVLRPELVEEKIIDQALYFLTTQQNSDGSMREPGRVIHTDMQGAVSSPLTMTAYVLVTLKETDFTNGNETINRVADKARSYLEEHLDSIRSNAYPLALVTYALQLSGSEMADSALSSLEQLATVSGAEKYWSDPTRGASTYSDEWRPPYYEAPTNEIEMTAYVLLIYAHRNEIAPAIPIIKWLTSKQNDLGGYSSTQDTVIAIQALSTIAGLMSDNEQSLTVTATHDQDNEFDQTFNINRDNRMVFNTASVPSLNGNLVISSSGEGTAVAQLSVCYNIPNEPFDEEPFACQTTFLNEDLDKISFKFCCSLKEGENKTGMFLYELGFLNGFTVDLDEEKSKNRDARRVELDDGKINFYYDDLLPGREICAETNLQRFADVAEVKAAPIVALDYYQPKRRVNRLYSVERVAQADACQVCGSKCVGCPAPAWSSWDAWSLCNEFCRRQNSTRSRRCEDPSTKRILEIKDCGLEEASTEIRECPHNNFPCPDVFDGLWHDNEENRLNNFFHRRRPVCHQKSSIETPHSGVPGSILSATNRDYIRCDSDGFVVRPSGFTISLLIKLTSYTKRNKIVILSARRNNHRKTFLYLQKPKKKNGIRLILGVGNKKYTVRKIIPISDLLNSWKHVVITWYPDRKLKIYINGEPKGFSSIHSPKNFSSKIEIGRKINSFYLGKSHGQAAKAGYMTGVLSTFMYWDEQLTNHEVSALYQFLENLVLAEEEPRLSLQHLHLMAPFEKRFCFSTPSSLSEIYQSYENKSFKCNQVQTSDYYAIP